MSFFVHRWHLQNAAAHDLRRLARFLGLRARNCNCQTCRSSLVQAVEARLQKAAGRGPQEKNRGPSAKSVSR